MFWKPFIQKEEKGEDQEEEKRLFHVRQLEMEESKMVSLLARNDRGRMKKRKN
jgi:hypothetical protein